MYAVVETGGKQYRVEKGSTLLVDRLSAEEGAKVDLRAVALLDKDLVVGKDAEKVKVEAKVAGHERGPKIRVFKYRAKKGYRAHPPRGDRDQAAPTQARCPDKIGGHKNRRRIYCHKEAGCKGGG